MSDLSGKKILLVEDDTFLAKALKVKLEENEIELTLAENGEKALQILKTYQPDVILLDLMMPQKNGFDVLKDLQKDEKWKKIPVIVISNLTQKGDMERATLLGAREVLIKSEVSTNDILQAISNY